jgi:FixJ family two-component response regulator
VHTTAGVVAVVEDDAAMRKSIERLLQANDFETIAYASAEEFLGCPLADSAGGLVIDIHLPGISGIELRRRLLAAGSNRPAIFITAHDDKATRAEALAAGCIEFLQKPFDPCRLTEALQRAMKS